MYKLAEVSWVITAHGLEVLTGLTNDYAPSSLVGNIHTPETVCDADGIIIERSNNEIVYMTRSGKLEVMDPDEDAMDSGRYPDRRLIDEHFWSKRKLAELRKVVSRPQVTWGELANFFKPIC